MQHHRTTDGASTSSAAAIVATVVVGSCCVLALHYAYQIRKHEDNDDRRVLIEKSLEQKRTKNDETSPIHSSVLDSIGNTPLMKVLSLSEMTKCEIYAKCEFYNPGGSVKDRVALQIVQELSLIHI